MFGPVRIRRAVRQGDPLSGLAFNFAFDPVIRALFAVKGVTVLVFVDDILIIADSPELLQTALDILKAQCAKLSLQINPEKMPYDPH